MKKPKKTAKSRRAISTNRLGRSLKEIRHEARAALHERGALLTPTYSDPQPSAAMRELSGGEVGEVSSAPPHLSLGSVSPASPLLHFTAENDSCHASLQVHSAMQRRDECRKKLLKTDPRDKNFYPALAAHQEAIRNLTTAIQSYLAITDPNQELSQ